MSHLTCSWLPTPTRLISFPEAPLRPPLGREGGQSGRTSLGHEASRSLPMARPFPQQQEAGPKEAIAPAWEPSGYGHCSLGGRMHRSHADHLYFLYTHPWPGLLGVTSSHRGRARRVLKTSLAYCWAQAWKGTPPFTLSWEHRCSSPPTRQHGDPAHLPNTPMPRPTTLPLMCP